MMFSIKTTENKSCIKKSKINQMIEICQMESSDIERISSEVEKLAFD